MRGHSALLGPGKEFDAVRSLLAQWGSRASGIGDDAAVLDVPAGHKLVVSTDTSVEHVHFQREWMTPYEIGWRATTAALSDLAAMGARPLGVLTAITVPPAWRESLMQIGEGIGAAAAAAGTHIIGGDLSAGAELSLSVTVCGNTTAPLTRGGARAGDVLWVTGVLGGPRAALRQWLAGAEPLPADRERFVHPAARINEGLWLVGHGATAAIDISDGLVADARHLAAASGKTLTIALEAVPCWPGVASADAAVSGEEYELLVAGPATVDAAAFGAAFRLSLTRVGYVGDANGTPGVIVMHGGARVEFGGGHDHFSG
jgi:thiamine-monophosphate kinase